VKENLANMMEKELGITDKLIQASLMGHTGTKICDRLKKRIDNCVSGYRQGLTEYCKLVLEQE